MTVQMQQAMTLAESAALVGIPMEPDADSIVVQIMDRQRIHSRLGGALAQRDVTDLRDHYLAAGGFLNGSVMKFKGRVKGNLKRIHVIPLDCDLADFIGADKDAVYAMPQEEIEALIPAMVAEVYFVAQMVRLPITVITYTGHGVQIITQLTGPGTDRIAEIDAALKALVKRINAVSPSFLDTQASDAGTRLFRAPGTLNTKCEKFGQPARRVRVLETPGEMMTVDELLEIAQIAQKPAPTRITPPHGKALIDSDAQLIVGTLAPHWTLGQKHAMSLAVSGMLAKAGVPESQALAIVEQLSANDEKPWDRARSVATSYERYRAGADVRGYYALREYVPAEAADFVDGILDRFRQSNAPRIEIRTTGKATVDPASLSESALEKAFTKRYESQIKPCPETAFYGWFGEYRDLMARTTEAPDQFHLGASLTLAAAMSGKRIANKYNSGRLFPNLYTVLIGRTGFARKDTAIDRAMELPYNCPPHKIIQPPYGIFYNVSSSEGLMQSLKDNPNAVGRITELTAVLTNAKRKGTRTIIDSLIHAYDAMMPLQNNSKINPVVVNDYYLNLIAATQPGRLANEMTTEEIESGFANRWLFIFGTGKEPMAITDDVDSRRAGDLYLKLWDAITAQHDGTVVDLDPPAKSLWTEWYLAEQKEIRGDDDEDRADMRARHATLIRKVALLYAITDASSVITETHLQCAMDFVAWTWGEVSAVLRTWGASMDIQLEERIRAVLGGGPVTRRELQQRVGGRKYSARDFAMTFDAMVKNQSIHVDATGLVSLP
jgi:hypothetical protein